MWNQIYIINESTMYIPKLRFSCAETFVTTGDIFQFLISVQNFAMCCFFSLYAAALDYYISLHNETPTTKIM